MLPKISVIMSTYNENLKELHYSIYSILNQKYPNFEFIILDDNPKSIHLKNYLLKFKHNKKVHLIFNKNNLGAAASRNEGAKYANGKFIAIMDADDIADKSRLIMQLRFLKHYNLDFVFPNYKIISENGKLLEPKAFNMKSIINQTYLDYIFGRISNISINSGWLIKTRVFKKLDGYRYLVVEDYDFIIRAIISKYRLGFQSTVLMSVRFRKNSVMRENTLILYLTSKYIKRSLINKNIFTLKGINKFLRNSFTKEEQQQFNKFIVICHKLKYHFSLKNLFIFIYSLIFVKYAFGYTRDKLLNPLKMKIFLMTKF